MNLEIMLSSGKIIKISQCDRDFLSMSLNIMNKYDLTFTELSELFGIIISKQRNGGVKLARKEKKR